LQAIEQDGYFIVEGVLDKNYIDRAKKELAAAIEIENDLHNGAERGDKNMVLLCSLYCGAFWELFDNKSLIEPFEMVLGPGCIAYAYTSSSMPPGNTNYSSRIHVDSPRLIPGYVTNVGATILLDDFTEENGATWYLPKSHVQEGQPEKDIFYRDAKRLVHPAGTVFFFNARLWHAGGINSTTSWRHALTINMVRPWMKQRLDIPRSMEKMNLSKMSNVARQKLGFLAQVPSSYQEYYAPPEHRKFKQKAE